jgi:cyclopropane fatty-acyl-phospholipid synthase-like methyltransferase
MRNFLSRLTFSIWYFFNPPWDTGISPPELIDFIANHSPGKAIDIGCGTGTNVITLEKAGWQVTGVDFVPRAIKKAKRKTKQAGIQAELHVRDVTNLTGINGPFDLALDIGCFHSIGDKKVDYLSELDRILAPGGHWLMYGFFSTDQSSPFGSAQDRPGLVEADLNQISASLTQVWRQDGFDRGERTSAWFLYQKT